MESRYEEKKSNIEQKSEWFYGQNDVSFPGGKP